MQYTKNIRKYERKRKKKHIGKMLKSNTMKGNEGI